MRPLLTFLITLAVCVSASAQQSTPPPSGKKATQVDSISAPPRMDGNTGRYDTVKRNRMPPGKRRRSRTTHDYPRNTDTLKARPAQ